VAAGADPGGRRKPPPPPGGRGTHRAAARLREEQRRGRRWAGPPARHPAVLRMADGLITEQTTGIDRRDKAVGG